MDSLLIAQRISYGSRESLLLSLSINDALNIVEIPDPNLPFPGNRRVSRKHAIEFGNYWESAVDSWIVPPLLLDCESYIERSDIRLSDTNMMCKIELDELRNSSLKILDGQHRILGWHLKRGEIDQKISDETNAYNKAVFSKNKVLMNRCEHQLTSLRMTKDRFEREKVALNILDSLSHKMHQQFFVDIARNALGINKTVQAKFDSASVINRVSQNLIKSHELLISRVDLEKTSCSGNNKNLLSVVNVSDIVRHCSFGINARVTLKREDLFSDKEVQAIANEFLNVMVRSLSALKRVEDGTYTPATLRKENLIGSGTIWRCLAGAFNRICVIRDEQNGTLKIDLNGKKRFERLVTQLSNQLLLPINRHWFATGLFPAKTSTAPSSRSQDLETLVSLLVQWAESGELFSNVPRSVK
jgi:hypothetical protein